MPPFPLAVRPISRVLTAVLAAMLTLTARADPAPGKNLAPPLTQIETSRADYDYMGAKNWQFALFGTAKAAMALEGETLKVTVTQVDGTDWHTQIRLGGDAVNGAVYDLHFRARADAPRRLRVFSEFNDEKTKAFNPTGLDRTFGLTPQWQAYAARFTAHDAVDGKCILPEFFFGQKPGTVWLSDVSLVQLPHGSSLVPPITDAAAWRLEVYAKDAQGVFQAGLGPKVTVAPEAGALRFAVSGDTKNAWAAYSTRAALKEKTDYTLTFRARGDVPFLAVQGEKEPQGVTGNNDGLMLRVSLTPQWQTFHLPFTTAPATGGQNKAPEFVVSESGGAIWISDVSLVEGVAPSAAPAPSPDPAPAPAPAPAQAPAADPGPRPRAGEIKLSGAVMAVRKAAKSLLIAVTAVTEPDGATTTLPAPRPKTVLLTAQTLIVTPDLTRKALADLKEGTAVSVIGKDAGPGKTLTARTVIVGVSAAGLPPGAGRENLLPPVTDVKQVRYQQRDPARVRSSLEDGARKIEVNGAVGSPVGARLGFGMIPLTNGQRYRLSLMARGDAQHVYNFASFVYAPDVADSGDKHNKGGTTGLEFQFWVKPQWQKFETTFTARNMVPGSLALIFLEMGIAPGVLWLKDVTLVPVDAPGDVAGGPVDTASAAPVPPPPGAGTINSVETIIADMSRLGDAMPHGAYMHGWALRPGVSWGRTPPPGSRAIAGPWGQLYETAEGSRGWNARVEFRDMEEYVRSKRDHTWRLVARSRLVQGAAFREDFFQGINRPANTRLEPGGTLSAKAGGGYNFHFWPQPPVDIGIDRDDADGIFTTVQARLIPEDPSVPDHFALTRYMLSVGTDYNDHEGAGMGRFKFVTPQWQAFNFTNLSPDEIRQTPPPLH